MSHPRCRTWTLGTLDRDASYRLWFDPTERRWEVAQEGTAGVPLTTRSGPDRGGAPAGKRSAAGGPAAGRAADGTGTPAAAG